MRRVIYPAALLFILCLRAEAASVLIEAEAFADRGGWMIDQQSMDVMGSTYLLAHGLGVPVADAVTTVTLPKPGEYRVFVRTKDWVARWNAPGAPGRFQVLIDGKPLEETFGAKGADWSWHGGGTVTVSKPEATLTLHDLTGFAGRCDAIVLTDEPGFTPPNEPGPLAAFRKQGLGLPDAPDEAGRFDVVVVGGGVAGCCAAVSSARFGLKVALIQDRPVLGGNSSSEVRVWISGRIHQPPYPVIGEIVAEMFTRPEICPGPAEAYGDDLKLKVVLAEENLDLRLSEHVFKVEMEGLRIKAVVSKNIVSSRETRFEGRWFVDATGDATVGFLAGADWEMTAQGHLGTSNMWYLEDTGSPTPFPRCPWALDLSEKPFPTELKRLGKWFWESGFDLDTVGEAEAIRDHNFRAMFGAWDALKNVKNLYPNHRLAWAAAISGKRESRRLLGDVVLTKDDVLEGREFPDGCVASTWSIDLHYPHPEYASGWDGNEFISYAEFTPFKKNPYPVPYRCLYSRNVPNLMMAGRDISVTHGALGTVRVMATGGLMGEVLGRAASLCKKHDADPRDVYEEHLDEFKALLAKPTRKHVLSPPEFAESVGKNVALGAKVDSSGDYDLEKQPRQRVNDGVANTYDNTGRWLSHAHTPNWVELSWEEPRTVVAARIISGYNHGGNRVADPISDFVLQWFDGDAWQDVPETRTRGNEAIDWQRRFPPFTSVRIRLLVEGAKGGISRIWEIELYEPPDRKKIREG
ncbi:MAG: FAD-dependent oxidoreductase [Planctomycetota bacterium]